MWLLDNWTMAGHSDGNIWIKPYGSYSWCTLHMFAVLAASTFSPMSWRFDWTQLDDLQHPTKHTALSMGSSFFPLNHRILWIFVVIPASIQDTSPHEPLRVLVALHCHHQRCLFIVITQLCQATDSAIGICPVLHQDLQHVHISSHDGTPCWSEGRWILMGWVGNSSTEKNQSVWLWINPDTSSLSCRFQASQHPRGLENKNGPRNPEGSTFPAAVSATQADEPGKNGTQSACPTSEGAKSCCSEPFLPVSPPLHDRSPRWTNLCCFEQLLCWLLAYRR